MPGLDHGRERRGGPRPGSTSRWQRDLKVYLVSGETPKRHRRLEELDWSELPDEVREKRLRDGSAELTFVLFPHAPRRTP